MQDTHQQFRLQRTIVDKLQSNLMKAIDNNSQISVIKQLSQALESATQSLYHLKKSDKYDS